MSLGYSHHAETAQESHTNSEIWPHKGVEVPLRAAHTLEVVNMKNGVEKVSRAYWYATGGLENTDYFRQHNGRCWEYFVDHRY